MKWFQHSSSSHTDMRICNLLLKHGTAGYALYYLAKEIVAKDNDKTFKIDNAELFEERLSQISLLEVGKVKEILRYLGELGLVNPKALKEGILHIPSLREEKDNYSKYVRSNLELPLRNPLIVYLKDVKNKDQLVSLKSKLGDLMVDTKSIRLGDISIDNSILSTIRLKYLALKSWNENNLCAADWARITNASKRLMLRVESDNDIVVVIQGLEWLSQDAKKGGYNWTIETLEKKWAQYMSSLESTTEGAYGRRL